MTREEAIKELIRAFDVLDFSSHMDNRRKEAFNMAKVALEQEPCSDAVSRQAVLDCAISNNFNVWIPIDRVRALPSVNPQEPKWIPVSEKLPKDEQVLLQYETPKGHTRFVVSWVDIWGRWQNIDGNFIPIAWMPLPKSYEPQEISDHNLKMWHDIYEEEKRRKERSDKGWVNFAEVLIPILDEAESEDKE